MTALIGDEHIDPLQPYPSLPNLVFLSLYKSSITDQGCIELSKSQLLDQLGYLDLYSLDPRSTQIGTTALLTTPLYSNMKRFRLPRNFTYNISPETTYQHLTNANNNSLSYIDIHKIDQFWD